MQGADQLVIQKVLHHSQLSTTRRYVHVAIEVTKAALTRLEAGVADAREKAKQKEEQERRAAAEPQATVLHPQTEMIQ